MEALSLRRSQLSEERHDREYIQSQLQRETHLREDAEGALQAVSDAWQQDQAATAEVTQAVRERGWELRQERERREMLEEQVRRLERNLAEMRSKFEREHERANEAAAEVQILVKRLSVVTTPPMRHRPAGS